jgi:hypothetical protein
MTRVEWRKELAKKRRRGPLRIMGVEVDRKDAGELFDALCWLEGQFQDLLDRRLEP